MNKDLNHRWLIAELGEMRNYARDNQLNICEDALNIAFAVCIVGLAPESMKTDDMEPGEASQASQMETCNSIPLRS